MKWNVPLAIVNLKTHKFNETNARARGTNERSKERKKTTNSQKSCFLFVSRLFDVAPMSVHVPIAMHSVRRLCRSTWMDSQHSHHTHTHESTPSHVNIVVIDFKNMCGCAALNIFSLTTNKIKRRFFSVMWRQSCARAHQRLAVLFVSFPLGFKICCFVRCVVAATTFSACESTNTRGLSLFLSLFRLISYTNKRSKVEERKPLSKYTMYIEHIVE